MATLALLFTSGMQLLKQDNLQIIHLVWAFNCAMGWSWSKWTESPLGGTKLEPLCSPERALSGTRLLRRKRTLKCAWCEPQDPSTRFFTIQILYRWYTLLANVGIIIKKKIKICCYSSLCHQIMILLYSIVILQQCNSDSSKGILRWTERIDQSSFSYNN